LKGSTIILFQTQEILNLYPGSDGTVCEKNISLYYPFNALDEFRVRRTKSKLSTMPDDFEGSVQYHEYGYKFEFFANFDKIHATY
jgi:hypothetical protein